MGRRSFKRYESETVCSSMKRESACAEQPSEGEHGVQQLFGMDALGDEDDPGAAVLVGPLAEVLGRMDDVLHAVEDDGSCLADVEETLDAQHVLTPGIQQHAEPDPERRPVDGPVERDRDGVRIAYVVRLIGISREKRRRRVCPYAVRAKEFVDVHLPEGSLEGPG